MERLMPFKLHVTSALGIPDIGIDYIQYPASHIIKLEAGNYAVVNTGIIISSCDTAGTILVTICDKYKDMIQISHNNFNPHQVHNNLPMVVHLYNSTDQFIRINTDEKIFKYQWSPIEPSTQVSAESSIEETEQYTESEVSNDDENSTTNNKVSVDGEENTISFPTNNDENTAPINQTSTNGDENSIAMDNSVSVQPTVRRVRRLVKKRII
jgi:hypothetical protein